MSSDDTDRYNTLVMRSQLKKSFPEDTYETINTERFIPLEELEAFYTDSLFYLHFFNTLYLEIYMLDRQFGFDITKLNDSVRDMRIRIDTVTVLQSDQMRMGVFSVKNTSNPKPTFTFYLKMFERYYHNKDAYAYYNTKIQELATTSNTLVEYPFIIKLPANDPSAQGGESAKATIRINSSTGEFVPNPKIINIEVGGKKFFSNLSANQDYTFYNSEMNPKLVDLDIGTGIFKNVFTDTIADLKFTVNDGSITKIEPMNSLRGSIPQKKLTPNTGNEVDLYKPHITDILLLPTNFTFDNDNIIDRGSAIATRINNNQFEYNPTTSETSYNLNANLATGQNIYRKNNAEVRKKRFRKIIFDVLTTKTENIYGYLLYQKIYYNCIVCNTCIQILVRELYLNNSSLDLHAENQSETIKGISGNLITYVNKMKANLESLRGITSIAAKDFITDKDFYIDRIVLLEDVRTNFNETLEVLNSTTFDYNQYLNYYSKIKTYTSSIIIFLVAVIIFSIAITVLPNFDYNAKNSYYILILIILIIVTIVYYYNFRHIGLYEKFTNEGFAIASTEPSSSLSVTTFPYGFITNQQMRIDSNLFNIVTGKGKDKTDPNSITRLDQNARILRNNNYHREFSNEFFGTDLFNYNGAYLVLSTEISTSIHVSNNKSFSKGTNDYLFKLYVEKTRLNELNKLRKTKFGHVIEAIKKQITFMYNLILIICCIAIILVICLFLYNLGTVSMEFIIYFAIISLILVMFTFIFALVQPTRMKANKNYWSNTNPSEVTLNKL